MEIRSSSGWKYDGNRAVSGHPSTLHPYKGAVPVQALPTKVYGQKARYTHKLERDSLYKLSEADGGLDCTEWGPGRAGHGLRSRRHSGPLPLPCIAPCRLNIVLPTWSGSKKLPWKHCEPPYKLPIRKKLIWRISANAQNHVLALAYIALLSRLCPIQILKIDISYMISSLRRGSNF